MTSDPKHFGRPAWAVSALALASLAPFSTAHAEASPYYVGVSQALAFDSNLYRLSKDEATPTDVKKRSDIISTTSLVGGVDQTIGRQRLYGSASLQVNRFANNDSLNNQSYALNLGLDWQTVNRLSGTLSAASSRKLRRFDPNESTGSRLEKNIETINLVNAIVRLGVVTRLTAEAGLNWRQIGYTAAAYNRSEYDQTGGSVGLRYRLGGATTVGMNLRASKTNYPSLGASRNRQDIDLYGSWVPSGLTSVSGRLGYGRTDSSSNALRDFRGVTGEVNGLWQATGKIRLNARLARDTGQESAFQSATGTSSGLSNDFSRTTTAVQLGADYAYSAKIRFTSGLSFARRDLSNSSFDQVGGSSSLDGSDTTTTLSLGARWAPTRAIQVGCDLTSEQRTASSNLSRPYSSNGVSCFGQFTIQ